MEILRRLVRHGADVNACDVTGSTALHAAALKNQVGTIDTLMELGANIDARGGQDDARWTPLHLASDQGLSQAVIALLRHGADVRRLGRHRDSALHLASRRGDPITVCALLAAGASLTVRNSSDDSVLDSAASMGHVEVVKVLIQHGASVDATDSQGRTALFKAHDAEAVIDVLVAAGARVDGVVDLDGTTPLHAASMLGHTPLYFIALLNHGARVDVRNCFGETPLHAAAAHGFHEGVQALLERRVDKNELTDRGRSPLSLAAENGWRHVTQELLDAGADVSCSAHYCSEGSRPDVRPGYSGNVGGKPLDKYRVFHSNIISDAGNAAVLKLFEMAPQDRAWRRCGWLVLCRILPDRVRLKANNGEASTVSPRSVRARGGDGGSGGGGGGGGGGSLPSDAPAAGEAVTGAADPASCTNPAAGRLSVLVARVVSLDEEGVFRNIMAFV